MGITKNKQSNEMITAMAEKAFPDRTVKEIKELTEGMCNAAYMVSFEDGIKSVLKISSSDKSGFMTNEANLMSTEVKAMKLVNENSNVKIRTLSVSELPILSELFDYNDIEDMIAENVRNIDHGIVDIFGLFKDSRLLGELHVMYQSEDEQAAVLGKRAYLFAFRIHEDFQGRGLGKYLMKSVIEYLEEKGYSEFTIGVEDDNARAIHIYEKFGFDEIIARKREEYQGDAYEYNLYLRR